MAPRPYLKHLVLLSEDGEILKLLPEGQRLVLEATQVEPKPPTYEELSASFKIPIGTIKSRLHRARQAILFDRTVRTIYGPQ